MWKREDKQNLGVYMNYGIVEILDKITKNASDRFQSIKDDRSQYIVSFNPKPNSTCNFYLFNVGTASLDILKNFKFNRKYNGITNNCNHFTRGIIEFYNDNKGDKPD